MTNIVQSIDKALQFLDAYSDKIKGEEILNHLNEECIFEDDLYYDCFDAKDYFDELEIQISKILETEDELIPNLPSFGVYFEICGLLKKYRNDIDSEQRDQILTWYFELEDCISSDILGECLIFGFIRNCKLHELNIPNGIKFKCLSFYQSEHHDYFEFEFKRYTDTERSRDKKIVTSCNDEWESFFGSKVFDTTNINKHEIYEWQFYIIYGSSVTHPFEICIGITKYSYGDVEDFPFCLCSDGEKHYPSWSGSRRETPINRKNNLVYKNGDIVCMALNLKEGMLGFYVMEQNQNININKIKYRYIFKNIQQGEYRMFVAVNSGSVQLL